MSAFEELGVMPEIIAALEDMDWQLPTPVQTESIPLILGGGDVAVAAETGAGKTGAFCLPIVQIVYETRRTNLSKSEKKVAIQAPTGPIHLSDVDRGRQIAIQKEKSVVQCRHPSSWQGVRATRGVTQGKWYYTVRVEDEGLCRVGWSSASAALNLGTDKLGFGYGGTAKKSNEGNFVNYGTPYGKNDTICCMIEYLPEMDLDGSQISMHFMCNEEELGNAFTVSWSDLGEENIRLFPAFALKNAQMAVNFDGGSALAESLGFRPIGEASEAHAELSQQALDMFKRARPDDENTMKDIDEDDDKVVGDRSKNPLALILEPSRELAGQVEEELTRFSKYLEKGSVKHLLLTGGGNPRAEKSALSAGRDIITGTLGSIVRHVKKGTLSLDNIRFFVLDEADTFAAENMADILFLHDKVHSKNRAQTLLFSATLHSPEIRNLSEKIQSFPIWIDLKGKEAVPESVHHTLVRLDADSDTALLNEAPESIHWPLDDVHLNGKKTADRSKKAKIGKMEDGDSGSEVDAADVRSQLMKKLKLVALKKAIDANSMSHAMLFVRTQRDGDNLESFLLQCSGVAFKDVESCRLRGRRESGPEVEYSCAVLHGGRKQQERIDALAAFKAEEVRFLICTDVAARGIDVVGLPFLVNVTLPDKSENYIHRVGRVGRAERLGMAVSLVSSQKEAVWYHSCKKAKAGVCNNRKLVDVGGCVMWYNESKILAEIEERLKGPIEELGDDFRRKNETCAPSAYGSRIGEEEVGDESAQHIEKLKPTVRKLVKMEEDAQAFFFALQQGYEMINRCQ